MAPTTLAEPSALSAAPHAHVPTRTPMSAAQQTPSTLVLVVEDNPEDAALVKAAAERACPDVTFKFLSDGRHAVAYLAGHDEFADRQAHPLPHAVLLDVRLPGLDGFQVLEHIRQLRHCDHLKVLLWSSAFDHCVASWVKEAGAHDFVPKPSSFHQLTEHVRCLADLARAALNPQPSTSFAWPQPAPPPATHRLLQFPGCVEQNQQPTP